MGTRKIISYTVKISWALYDVVRYQFFLWIFLTFRCHLCAALQVLISAQGTLTTVFSEDVEVRQQ